MNGLGQKLVSFLDENFNHKERVDFFAKRKIYSLEIELTSVCDLTCLYCYPDSVTDKNGRFLPLEKAKAVLEQAMSYGIREIWWYGGEPLIHPKWFEILSYARKLGLRNTVYSNGTRLKENIDGIIKSCEGYVLHIDSIDPEVFTATQLRIRDGAKTLNKILQGFDDLLEKGFPSKCIRLNVTLTRRIISTLERTLCYFVEQKGIQTVTLIPMYPCGRGLTVSKDEHLTPPELYEAFKLRAQVEQRPELLLLGTSEYCKIYQLTNAYITAAGNVIPYAGINSTVVGNIYRDNLADVLRNHYETLSFAHLVGENRLTNLLSGSCATCQNSQHCFGTRCSAHLSTGSISKSDPTCWLVRNN